MGQAIAKNLPQHAFTTGEISQSVLGRQDLSRYSSGLLLCENFQISPQGGLYNDTGTIQINEAKFGATGARVVPFQFSNVQAYILEFGNEYVRFYANGGRIENPPGTPVEVVTPYAAADLPALNFTQSGDFLYIVHPNYPPAAIIRAGNTSWSYESLAFEDGPYQDANNDPTKTMTASAITGTVTVTANFNAFVAGNVGAMIRLEEPETSKYNQWVSGVCYPNGALVTNAGNVYECTNGSTVLDASGYALGQWQNEVSYPENYFVYWGNNVYKSTVNGTSGNTPPTWTSGTGSDGQLTWEFIGLKSGIRAPVHGTGTQSDSNLNWLYLHSGFGYGRITGYTSPTQVTIDVISSQLPNSVTGGTLSWRLGAFDSSNGYPSCIGFLNQRLVLAATPNLPETLWMSNTGDFYNFAPTATFQTVLDTNTINITLASGTINTIVWISPSLNRLLVGTIGSEWEIMQEVTTSGFSPSNVQARPMSAYGSAPVEVRPINLATMYVSRSMYRAYEMTYQYLIDAYTSKDMNLMNDSILREGGGIVDTAYQREPFSTYWLLRADGVLIGLTYLPDEQVTGWHRHVYNGFIESIASIPSNSGGNDELWCVMRYTINGSTVRYIQQFADQFYPNSPTDTLKMWYVEAGLSISSETPVSTISGLDYLDGRSVVPIVDGSVQPAQTVVSGSITLQTAGLNVVVGLPYTSQVTILPLEFDIGSLGSSSGQQINSNYVTMRVLNSIGYSYGLVSSLTSGVQNFTPPNAIVGQAPQLYTGTQLFNLGQISSPDTTFSIGQTQPYPLNILSVTSNVKGYAN